MGFLEKWLGAVLVGPARDPIADPAALRDFLSAQASFIAQKVVTEYCQAKAGRYWSQLSTEQSFISELARGRWEAFALVLSDLFVIAEGHLRPSAMTGNGGIDALRAPLARLYAEALDAYPWPVHRPAGWGDRVAAFEARLAAVQAVEPQPARAVAEVGGRAIFEVLPIHLNMRHLDRPMVVSGIAFQMVAFAGRIRRRLDAPALAAALLHPGG